jgi:hypothetical protein
MKLVIAAYESREFLFNVTCMQIKLNGKYLSNTGNLHKKINSLVLVCDRTTPTKRLPLVGEVSANFSG